MRRYKLIFFALLEIYIYSSGGIDGEVEGTPCELVAGRKRNRHVGMRELAQRRRPKICHMLLEKNTSV